MNTFPPSPLPPFHRPVVRLSTGSLTGSGTVTLDKECTYLENVTRVVPPYEVTLPDGRWNRERHELHIPRTNVHRSADFVILGKFVNFNALLLNRIAQSAVLEWDGLSWHVVGGNVANKDDIEPYVPPTLPEEEGTNVRTKNGQLQIKSPDNDLWYDAVPRVVGEAVVMSMEGEGEA